MTCTAQRWLILVPSSSSVRIIYLKSQSCCDTRLKAADMTMALDDAELKMANEMFGRERNPLKIIPIQ